MNKKAIIEIAKFTGALTIGIVVGAVTRPAVKDFFKINKSKEPDTIPAEDIEEDEVSEENEESFFTEN